MKLENLRTKSKPLERDKTISEHGANRSKSTGGFRKRSNPLERDKTIENQGQTKRQRLELDKNEQTSRKRLGKVKTRSKPSERDVSI